MSQSMTHLSIMEKVEKIELLESLSKVKTLPKFTTLEEFLELSQKFEKTIHKAPTKANWIKTGDSENYLEFANSSYPILHEDVLTLCHQFSKLKKIHGTSKEKTVYENMSVIDLIDRLIKKVNNHL